MHESTFYRWIGEPKNKLQRELCEGLKKEEAAFKHTLLTAIRAAALARNQYWTAAAWLLERKYPDEYGKADRQRNDTGDEAVPKIVLGVVAQPVQTQMDFGGGAEGTGAGVASAGPISSLAQTATGNGAAGAGASCGGKGGVAGSVEISSAPSSSAVNEEGAGPLLSSAVNAGGAGSSPSSASKVGEGTEGLR